MAIQIEHVGSTAVPGLPAKPIIDMDVLVAPERLGDAISSLARIGYEHEGDGGIAGREAFRTPDSAIAHHLYVSSPEAANGIGTSSSVTFFAMTLTSPPNTGASSWLWPPFTPTILNGIPRGRAHLCRLY